MSILKPMGFDSYAYQIGEFPIALADQGKVKEGMFCKLNAKKEICVAGAGEKGFMVIFPKTTNRSGFATLHGTFYVGPFTLNVDGDCFDTEKTYVAQQPLYIGEDGKLTNDSSVSSNPIPVAQVLRPVKEIKGKKALAIASYTGIV